MGGRRESRGDGHGGGGLADVFLFVCPCIVSVPWSCGPQPLGSGGDATPCEDPRQESWTTVQARSRVSFNGCSPRRGGPPGPTGPMWASEQSDTRGVPRQSEPHSPLRHQLLTRLGETPPPRHGNPPPPPPPPPLQSPTSSQEPEGRRPEKRWAPSPESDGRQPKDWFSGALRGTFF